MSTRREFLRATAAAGAALSVPYVWTPRSAHGQDGKSDLRIGAIGVGGPRGKWSQGGSIARAAAGFGQMVAVCDVDDQHTAKFNDDFDGKLAMYRDYREMFEKERLDAVTIGTPDHWHVPISLAALNAGCDVYCEKPLTLTIDEGIAIEKAVQESDRVFQVGTQQRSQHRQLFLKAVAIVQSGRLGKNVNAHLAIEKSEVGGPFETMPAPPDIDWNMWLGPTPLEDYSIERQKDFRWYFDYSGGKMTDWGAHHIDIAQWALGHDHSGPVKITGKGEFPKVVPDNFDWCAYLNGETKLPNAFNTAVSFEVELKYADGSIITVGDHYKREDGTEFSNGILFEGDKGRIFVNRGRLAGKPVDELTEADKQDIQERIIALCKGKDPRKRGGHMRNFFECIADRGEPISDVASHHRTMTSCHLSNIALMLGRPLHWDPAKQAFVNDSEADNFLSRRRREGFELT